MSRGAAPGGKVRRRLIGQSELSFLPHMLAHALVFAHEGKVAHFVIACHSFCIASKRLLNSGEPVQSGRLICVDLKHRENDEK